MFVCSNCGYQSIKWLGRCPSCNSWDSFVEEQEQPKGTILEKVPQVPIPFNQIKKEKLQRISTGMKELDRALGGGLVKGEVVLVGGEPGIGKSTLLLEVAANLSKDNNVLYVNAEESIEQVAIRADRIGVKADNLFFVNEDDLFRIYELIKQKNFGFLIIDSIQVVNIPMLQSPKGSVSQIKECANFLVQIAKTQDIIVFIVGHVTKEGSIAGPKLLEHIVDCVLYFESESLFDSRILRVVKNRFGPTGEIVAFRMGSEGLKEADDWEEIFLPHRDIPVSGSSVVCVVEGIKPIIVELQALVSRASFGMVKRRSLGFDFNRFSLMIAVIEKRLKISLSSEDVFLNVSGGLKINDPSADLGACISIISSYKDKEVSPQVVFLGEVGLAGEVRKVSNIELRIKEIKRLGFKEIFIPKAHQRELKDLGGLKVNFVDSLKEVVDNMW